MNPRAARRARRWSMALLLLASCTGFREVVPGVYRDRQPAEDELSAAIEHHGIRTVVMLRRLTEGSAPTRRAALAADIAFVNVPMSAQRLPPADTLLALWDAIDTAERPLLLHCRAGVDRAGLASALVVLHDTGDLAAARGQLALVPYGHTGWGTSAMDEVLDLYEPSHGAMPFPQWVREVYARRPLED
jgi:protein tyrosine phosphatase (PTP) superfamily phosphohydrolase (DUF442 family)